MSWLFSRVLVEEFSEATSLDGARSAPLSGSPTQLAYLSPDRMTAFSRLSRFGMTFKPLTVDLGETVLTSFLEAFPAKTLALPEKGQESTEPAAECGATWRGSLARFDPASSSWKTVQHSLLGDLGESSVTWPRSGMTAGGQCWELPTLGRRTSGTGFGWWQTPVADDAVNRAAGKWNSRSEPKLSAQVLMKQWPTPTSSLGTNGGRVTPAKAREGGTLIEALSNRTTWPTPTVCGNYNRKGASATSGGGLATAVTKWPTPIARDYKSGKFSQDGKAHRDGQTRGKPLSEQIGGSLNPTWVEWLMGWPLGWTDLKPLETAKSLSALQPLGSC